MSTARNAIKIAGINVFVFFMLVAALALLPPALLDLRDLFRGDGGARRAPVDPELMAHASLPNYVAHPWAVEHFAELPNVQTTYHDFIGWRRQSFRGSTITVDEAGYRQHGRDGARSPQDASVWVFGGSGVWGSGAPDHLTLPAQLEALTSTPTFNFGELAYTAHQGLNLLMKIYLAGGRPQHVVFYDGVNEVLSKCRTEHTWFSTMIEAQVRSRLQAQSKSASRLGEVFGPTLRLARKALARGGTGDGGPTHGRSLTTGFLYDCHQNEDKVRGLAEALAMDWKMAKHLVEQYGGTFHAVLQPVAYVGAPHLAHVPRVTEEMVLAEQYRVAYDAIRRELAEQEIPYRDLTGIYDGEEPLYFDFCHVSPEGNARVARVLASALTDGMSQR